MLQMKLASTLFSPDPQKRLKEKIQQKGVGAKRTRPSPDVLHFRFRSRGAIETTKRRFYVGVKEIRIPLNFESRKERSTMSEQQCIAFPDSSGRVLVTYTGQ